MIGIFSMNESAKKLFQTFVLNPNIEKNCFLSKEQNVLSKENPECKWQLPRKQKHFMVTAILVKFNFFTQNCVLKA